VQNDQKMRVILGVWAALAGVIYAAAIVSGTGLIPRWGAWHVNLDHHAAQAQALLAGRLGISDSPAALTLSRLWANGEAHQVWGLGVPILRVPFEWAALRLGSGQSPAHLFYFVFLSLWGWWILSFHTQGKAEMSPGRMTGALVAAALILLFPPFIGIMAAHQYSIMDGVLYWTFMHGMAVMLLLWRLLATGRFRYWLLLGVAAGFGPWIRPTLFIYGIAALLIATSIWSPRLVWAESRNGERPRIIRKLAAGWAVFLFLCGLLWASNWVRFGDGFEFGHSLNIRSESGIGTMYATRFDHPFEEAGFVEGMRELAGALFFISTERMNQEDSYRHDFFPGQSDRVRWRQFYFKVFDWTYLGLLGGGMILASVELKRRLNRRKLGAGEREGGPSAEESVPRLALWGWAFVSLLLLALFYWRVPVLASRYLMDFAPAFCAVTWLLWTGSWREAGGWRLRTVLLAVVFGWMTFQTWEVTSKPSGGLRALTVEEVRSRQRELASWSIPSGAYFRQEEFKETSIPFNGTGVSPNGNLAPMFLCFVMDPEFVELDLVSREDQQELESDPSVIRAKIGLEFLERELIERTTEGWRVRFQGPGRARHQTGVQVVFVAMAPREHLAEATTPWRLKSVRWREEN
jgi:hypothetical protein